MEGSVSRLRDDMTIHDDLLNAAALTDWEQVRLNGGPPCFHLWGGRFCLRARRWDGHGVDHAYVSLLDLIRSIVR